MTTRSSEQTNRRARAVMSTLFAASGVFHFLTPAPFLSIVPSWIPKPELMVALSGAAESAGAVGLLWPPTRQIARVGLILLLVAVFPANIQMLVNAIDNNSSWWWQLAMWIRLPLQPLMIWLVWRAGAGDERRVKAKAQPPETTSAIR